MRSIVKSLVLVGAIGLLASTAFSAVSAPPPTDIIRLSSLTPYNRAQQTKYATMVFPRRAVYYLMPTLSMAEAEQLAQWDLAVLAMDVQYTSPEAVRYLKQLNPNIRLLTYFAVNEASPDSLNNPTGSLHDLNGGLTGDDWLYTPQGTPVVFWPGTQTYNLLNQDTRHKLVQFLQSAPDQTMWDGIFLDNVWRDVSKSSWVQAGVDADRDGQADAPRVFNKQWVTSTQDFVHELRNAVGPNLTLTANMSGDNFLTDVLNGRMYEGFPNTLPSFASFSLNYVTQESRWEPITTNIIHTEGNPDDINALRRGLTFALMADGFSAFDHGPNASTVPGDTGFHDQLIWNADLYQPIGRAITKGYLLSSGLMVREFTDAIVIYNPTLSARVLRIILRNGSTVSASVNAEDGAIVRK